MMARKCVIVATGSSVEQIDFDNLLSDNFDYKIAVNSAVFLSKKFDICFASDVKWWGEYLKDVDKNIEKISVGKCNTFDVKQYKSFISKSNYNSALNACIYAVEMLKCEEIHLYGVDLCGDRYCGKYRNIEREIKDKNDLFLKQFKDVNENFFKQNNIKIYNCSPISKLELFEKKI